MQAHLPSVGARFRALVKIIEAHPVGSILIALLAVCAIVGMARWFASVKRYSLRAQVNRDIRHLHRGGRLGWARATLGALYFPSWTSIVTVAGALAITLLLIHWRNLHARPEDIVAVHDLNELEGKIALTFVSLMIFAVGLSSRSTASGSNLAEILLKKSYLFPVALFVLGLFVASSRVRDPVCAGCSVAVVSLLAVFTFYQLARSLLDEAQLEHGGVELLKDKLRRSVTLAVAERVGKNKILEELKGLPLEYSPFLLGGESDGYVIRALRPGVVHDIRMNKLVEFAERLERISNENGYAFGDKRKSDNPSAGPFGLAEQLGTSDLKVEKRRYLMKLFLDRVDEKYSGLLCYPRCLVQDEADRSKLEELGRAVFKIEEQDLFSERFRNYLGGTKDEAISAIEGHRTSRLETILEVYDSLLETFMDLLQQAGARYSLDTAVREAHSLGGGWNEVKSIRDQISEIVSRACRVEDTGILRQVVSALFRVGYQAITRRNHLMFLDITAFAGVLYRKVSEISSSQAKQYVLIHSMEFIKGMADYIEMELRRPGDQVSDALDPLADLATIVLIRVHELFGHCIETGRLDDFEEIERKSNQAFHGLLHFGTENEIERIEARLRTSPLTEQDREFYQAELARLRQLENVKERLENEKRQMVFAVGGRVFKNLLASPASSELVSLNEKMSSTIADSPSSLTELLNNAYKPLTSGRFGWESWDALAERPESAGAYDPYGVLIEYYCYCLLKICQNLGDEAIEGQPLPATADFVHEISEHGRITATLSSFEGNKAECQRLIPDGWLLKLKALRNLFDRVIAEQKRAEDDRLIQSPISAGRIQAFKDRFLEAFDKAATIRGLFRGQRAIVDKSRRLLTISDQPKWGLSLIEDKEAFVEGWHVEYSGWGEHHGRDLAESESQFVFSKLFDEGHPLPDKAGETIEGSLRRAIDTLREEGFSATVILANLSLVTLHELQRSGAIVPRWQVKSPQPQLPGFEGRFRCGHRQIPVFRVWGTVPEGAVWIGDLKTCANWVQLPAADDQPDRQHARKFFFLRIIDLGQDDVSRDAFLKSNPAWLASRAEKERYLSQKVWVQIFERFEITVPNPKACRRFTVARNAAGEGRIRDA